MTRAIALERSLIAGTAAKNAASQSLADDVAAHLRSLLRDVICGHLDPDLAVIADELLEPDELLHVDEDRDDELRVRRIREVPLQARDPEPMQGEPMQGADPCDEEDFPGFEGPLAELDADEGAEAPPPEQHEL